MAEFGARYVRGTGSIDEEKTIFNVKRVPKYGTSDLNSKTLPTETFECFVRHLIKDNDTLNSIALKYGLKTSLLKQVNKLWDDNIFVYESLLVPIQSPENLPPDFEGDILSRAEALKCKIKKANVPGSKPSDQNNQITSALLVRYDSPNGEEQVADGKKQITTDDYFSKFDSSISVIKSNLERLENDSRLGRRHTSSKANETEQRSQKLPSKSHKKPQKSSLHEPTMKFYRNPDGSSEAKILEKFEKLENEIFQL